MPILTPVALTVQTITSLYPSALNTLTWTAANAVNGNTYVATGREIVLARNDGLVSATLTIVSVADPYGRTEDIAQAIAAGAYAVGMLGVVGWRQPDGVQHLYADVADVKLAVIRLPTGAS